MATEFERFMERVLANPVARAAFERAQKQPPPITGGPEYRRRQLARRRSRR